jgi:hypothetical protein
VLSNYLVVSGDLVPNTELLAESIPINPKSRVLAEASMQKLEKKGIFIAGSMRGKRFGAYNAYLNGIKIGTRAANYLGK